MPSCKTARKRKRTHTPSAAVVIDHTAFPSLIDDIIAYCSVGALLQFRQTSKEYVDRIDPTLFLHVTIRSSSTAPIDPKNHVVCAPCGTPLPIRLDAGIEAPRTILDRQIAKLEGVRAVDVGGEWAAHRKLEPLYRVLASLETVRLSSSSGDYPDEFPPAPTCVVFSSLVGKHTRRGTQPWRPGTSPIEYPPGVRRLVMTIEWNPADMDSALNMTLHDDMREVVFIFRRIDRVRNTQRPAPVVSPAKDFGVVGGLLDMLERHVRVERVTFVDATDVHPFCFGIPREFEDHEGMVRFFKEEIPAEITTRRNTWYPQYVNSPLPEIEVLSGEEYAAKVGRETYRLQTEKVYVL